MDFEVSTTELTTTRVVDLPPAELTEGQARLAVRRFGFSANNITYAVFGEMMGYWSFFPAEQGWGRIPVWGFAEVVEAGATGLVEGELVYGYLPMGTELVVAPTRVSEQGFVDATPHRSALPAAYNGYTRCRADPVYDPSTEAVQMLFRPLFMTDFVLDDWLADNDLFGATAVVVSSASSKTAFGLAHLLSKREGCEVIGLTSAANTEFVEGLGCYDRVLSYDRVADIDAATAAVYVDVAGDSAVRLAVHSHLPGLAASVLVGMTHWGAPADDAELPGPTPALFFAPDQVVKRRADWGPGGFDERFAAAWEGFLPMVAEEITVVEVSGFDDMKQTYLDVLAGTTDANSAVVIAVDS